MLISFLNKSRNLFVLLLFISLLALAAFPAGFVRAQASGSETPTPAPPSDTPLDEPGWTGQEQTPTPINPNAPDAGDPVAQPGSDSTADFHVISDGQFVYGPNIGTFKVQDFISLSAPQLAPYAETIYGRAEYYSINPKVYLALIEMASGLVSNTSAASGQIENPLGLAQQGFTAQLDALSEVLFDAYYLHLYTFSAVPAAERSLPPITLMDGSVFAIPGSVNAGTYAVAAGLAKLRDASGMAAALDNPNPESFVQTYLRLFPADDPLDESNQVGIPGEVGAQSPPAGLLQFPYPRGEAWTFNGVHNSSGSSVPADMSSIDFSKGWPAWGADTSSAWVVAAASGVPTRVSSCSFRVDHGSGWQTAYYHLDSIQTYTTWINQNDQIGVMASDKAQALCNGGGSTGPHVHFTLKYNGVWVALDGTALSGWVVHNSGRWSYDYDPNYNWLEREGVKKYAYYNPIINDTANSCTSPTLNSPPADFISTLPSVTFNWAALTDCAFTGYNFRVKDVSDMESGGNTLLNVIVGTATTTATIPADGYYRDLYWGVRAASASGGANWAVRRFQVVPVPLAPVLNTPADGAENPRTQNATLTWNAAAGASAYYVEWSDGAAVNLHSGWITSLSWASGVHPAGSYTWRVKARNSSGEGPWSTLRSALVQYGAPGTLSGTGVSQSQINLSWKASLDGPTNIEGYRIYRGGAALTTVAPSLLSFADTGLGCGMSYTYIVKAYKGARESPASASTTPSTYACTPNAPTLLTPDIGATLYNRAVTFTWQSPNSPSQNGYTLRLSVSPDPQAAPWLLERSLANTSLTTSFTFAADGVYYWHMRTWNINAIGSAWVTRTFTVHGQPPGLPVLISPANAVLLNTFDPILVWGDALDADHYQVQIATGSAFSSTTLLHEALDVHSPYTLPLPPNDRYYWRVRAVNPHGLTGAWSGARSFNLRLAIPVLVEPALTGQALSTRPTLDWNDVPGAAGYTIQLSTSPNFLTFTVNTATTASSYTPKADLLRSVTYYWRVMASGTKPSLWSDVYDFTSANPPLAPLLLAPASKALLTGYTPTLDWSNPIGADHYQVQLSTSSSFSTTIYSDSTLTISEFTVPAALAPNKTHYWRVRVYDSLGQYSQWTAARSFRTALLPPVLLTPTDGSSAVLTTRPTFTWGTVTAATSYVLQISASPLFTPLLLNTARTSPTYTLTADLPRAATLFWRVSANGTNPSAWSTVSSFTSADPPAIPTLLTPASLGLVTDYTPDLTWNAVTGADHFAVQIATKSTFSAAYLVYDTLTAAADPIFTPPANLLPNKTYYWRVRSFAANGQYSLWTGARTFRTALLPPVVLSPADGAVLLALRPSFDWSDVSGASSYNLQISTLPDFSTRLVNAGVTKSLYTSKINLPIGVTLYWRVSARGANPSAWTVRSFSIQP